jgi:hypothetical protein
LKKKQEKTDEILCERSVTVALEVGPVLERQPSLRAHMLDEGDEPEGVGAN